MSQIPSEPRKYVESCVDDSRARSSFWTASARSWNAPSTISATASSVVIPIVWIRTSRIVLVTQRR